MQKRNNKIIGFSISSFPINHDDVDIFGSGLRVIERQHNGLTLWVWGVGDIESCFLNEKTLSLSFPISESLEDRNVIIRFTDDGFTVENDWLGSIPVFYNEKKGTVSTLIRKVIDSVEFDPEGLGIYLDLGYSALEKTPLKNIRPMRFYSKLSVKKTGIEISYKEDPVPSLLQKTNSSQNAIEDLTSYIQEVESKIDGKIVLPLSGGYDSRFIASAIHNTDRIKSFTYGISDDQDKSIETVRAREVAKVLNISWERIHIGKFHQYADRWFSLFGPSTHLHGMYHIEFYKNIKENLKNETITLASGIIGDAWSGAVKINEISQAKDVLTLGYSHGMHSRRGISKLTSESKAEEVFFSEQKELLQDLPYRIVTSMRFKIILLSYLMSVPDYMGIPSWTPFLNMKIACGLLTLPEEERKDREWEQSYFKEKKLDIENLSLPYSKQNSLNFQALQNHPLPPLEIKTLSPFFKKNELRRINRQYGRIVSGKRNEHSFFPQLMKKRFFAGIGRRLGINYNFLRPYYELLTLKSLELTLKNHGK